MTKEKIEQIINFAQSKKLTWHELAPRLMQHPFNLTAADATIVLDEYRKLRPPQPKDGPSGPGSYIEETVAGPKQKNHTPSVTNRSAIKSFALEVSEKKKNGKFDRVSKQFIQEVEAEIERLIRAVGGPPDPDDDTMTFYNFLNSARACPKLVEQLNKAVRRIIFRRVVRHPSNGQTLK